MTTVNVKECILIIAQKPVFSYCNCRIDLATTSGRAGRNFLICFSKPKCITLKFGISNLKNISKPFIIQFKIVLFITKRVFFNIFAGFFSFHKMYLKYHDTTLSSFSIYCIEYFQKFPAQGKRSFYYLESNKRKYCSIKKSSYSKQGTRAQRVILIKKKR